MASQPRRFAAGASQPGGPSQPVGGASQRFGSQFFSAPQREGCDECGSTETEEVEGVWLCVQCGARTGQVVEVAEANDNLLVRGAIRGRAVPKGRKEKAAPPPPAPLPVTALSYADCLQRQLHAFCEVLQRRDAPPELLPVAGRLWAAWVGASTLLELESVAVTHQPNKRKKMVAQAAAAAAVRAREKAAAKAARAAAGEEEEEEEEEGSEGDTSDSDSEGEKAAKRTAAARARAAATPRAVHTRSQLHDRVPLLSPLAVLFLAALWLRMPILHTDVVRMAASGELPYLGFHARLPAQLVDTLPPAALRPDSIPSPRALHIAAAYIAAAIGLELPPANGPALADRLAAELRLPAAAASAAARLLLLHAPHGLELGVPGGMVQQTERKAPPKFRSGRVPPGAHVAAALLLSLKLLYRLGCEDEASLAPPPKPKPQPFKVATLANPTQERKRLIRPQEKPVLALPAPAPAQPAQTAQAAPAAPPQPGGRQKSGGWLAWAARRDASAVSSVPFALLPRMPGLDVGEGLSTSRLRGYLSFLRTQLFAGEKPPYALSDAQTALAHAGASALAAAERTEALAASSEAGKAAAARAARLDDWRPTPVADPGALRVPIWRTAGEGGAEYCAVLGAVASHLWIPPKLLHETLVALEERVFVAEAAATAEAKRAAEREEALFREMGGAGAARAAAAADDEFGFVDGLGEAQGL